MNAPPSRGGGKPPGNKNRNRGGNNNNNNRRQRNKQNRHNKGRRQPQHQQYRRGGSPQSPTVKITIRNIGNVERYETVEAIAAGILRTLVDQTNQRLALSATATGAPKMMIGLDEPSLLQLVENDKSARQARLEWKNRSLVQADEAGEEEKEEENEPMEDVAEPSNTTENGNTSKPVEATIVSGMKELNIDNKEKNDTIHARTLYVVPPKKTRRRGEKPGNIYLVLTTPPIPVVVVEEEEVAPVVEREGEEANDDDNQTEEEKTAVPPVAVVAPAPPKVDYSRQIAERQLALMRAVEIMTAIAAEDAKGDQIWAGCAVEESINGKSWRAPQRKDHRDGTVQDSPGFTAFMEMTAKGKQDLQARPKPAPGGGLSALSSMAATTSDSTATNMSGKPVAALVLHLQNKRDQEKAQKKNKQRKSKDANKKKTGGPQEKDSNRKQKTARIKKNKKRGVAKKAADPNP